MGKYRIIIEGEGPHHSAEEAEEGAVITTAHDADKIGKDTVITLVALGHIVTRAGFQRLGEEQKEVTHTSAEVLQEDELVELQGAVVEVDHGTGEDDETQK
jgi:hypothetical protein